MCTFSWLVIYFTTLFVERKSVKWTEKRSALGSRTACSATGCTHHVLSYKSIFCYVSCHFADVRSFQRKCLWIDANHKLNDSDERGLPNKCVILLTCHRALCCFIFSWPIKVGHIYLECLIYEKVCVHFLQNDSFKCDNIFKYSVKNDLHGKLFCSSFTN